MDFSKLKSLSGKKSLEQLTNSVSKLNGGEGRSSDDRFWTPTVDKAGNGYAVIRFLPAPAGEDDPFVRVFDHGFQGPGGWYIENSLTTIGKEDPVSEYNSKLWNSGSETNKEIARKQKRRLHYISNIFVVTDSGNPANEGKVFLFKYGKKIFDKLNEAMTPQFADEEAVNPFDLWSGANFKLKIRNVENFRNYDKSEFDKSKPLHSDDDVLESIWKKEYSLQEFLDPKNFKSYEELKAKLTRVLGDAGQGSRTAAEDLPWGGDAPSPRHERTAQAPTLPAEEYNPGTSTDEDDDSLEYFRNLAK